MNDLESRQLRYFVAVAEELNFGRAAERLGMAQPPLSRAIRELERGLGVRLFERTTRQVALTAAGEVLLRDARTALEAITAAARRAAHAGRPVPELRLALKADFDAGLLPRFLDAYRREDAAIPVELVLGGRGEQEAALRDGSADVAVVPELTDRRGLDVEPLLTEPRLVALAASDPLAARSSLTLADLAGRVLPDGRPAEEGGPPPGPRDPAAPPPPPAAARGSFAGSRRPVRDLMELFSLVELGGVIWFVPVSIARRHVRPGIAYRAVADLPPAEFVVAWPQDCRSPAVAAFVRAATAVAAAAQPVITAQPLDVVRAAAGAAQRADGAAVAPAPGLGSSTMNPVTVRR
ncbi:LysR family transcriptional regulator [Actinomadura verrucosospora]|uniref:Putative lysR-type transcriptional regulator n=1 Tax=Actinomadura verrucosospora TaxID=46165 RepID=A0A7D3ZW00_ACTVE|nr:LysR family transcriptional regulator [Actinomadura verrucosospora]QKG19764.1 putative lysR-type transcriptional regulator [Actinomadura verrucosospora]